MCPNKLASQYSAQKGFLIPLAAFILVVISLLAAQMMRTSSQVSLAGTQEAISTQAFYAAESGAQAAMSVLFSGNGNRAAVDVNCTNVQSQTFSVDGLKNCSATVTCTCVDENNNTCNASASYSFYTIESSANCGAAAVTSNRIVQVSAFMQ